MSNIKVGIKFRPIDENRNNLRQWIINGNQIHSKNSKYAFKFSNVFDESSTNQDVYSFCSPIVQKSLNGFNGTILAYGQTSSGKTYTMMGDNKMKGIIEMAIDDIFDTTNNINDRTFILRVGFIEIYNEKIYDLLNNNKKRSEIRAFEYQGQLQTNHNEFVVKSKEEIIKYVLIGNRNKHIGSTKLNEYSSRSHTIFSISIDSTDSMGETKSSKLIFGDLAGSEKPDVTKSSFNEGLHINKSLLALGKIIRELSKSNVYTKNVHFRESMLTRLLASSLGGNSLTSIICTVSPFSFDETFNTICFAQNAERTRCKPISNSINDREKEVTILKGQVQKLQKELEFERSRIMENSIIHFNSTYQLTTNTFRKTECLKRKYHADSNETLLENPIKIFVQTDKYSNEDDKNIIEDLKIQISEFKKENEELKAQLHEYNENLENLTNIKKSLKHELKEESQKGWKIKEKCKMLRNKLKQKKKKLISMKEKSSNLIDTHDGLDNSSCDDFKEQYRQDILHKNLIIFGYEKELKKVKDSLRNVENSKKLVSTAVNTDFKTFQLETLEQKNYNQQHLIHGMNEKIQNLLYKNQVLQAQIDEANTQVNDIKRERDEVRKINSNMKNNFKESLKNTRNQFHSLLKQKQEQAADFRNQMTKFKNQELKDHLKMQDHYEKQFDLLKQNNKELCAKIEYLENDLRTRNVHLLQKSKFLEDSIKDKSLKNENERIKFVKKNFEIKLAQTIKFFDKLLDQKEKELNEVRKCQNSLSDKHKSAIWQSYESSETQKI